MRSLYLLAVLGLIAFSGARAEDPVDGEVTDDAVKVSEEMEEIVIGSSPDAVIDFIITQPADANILKELHTGKVIKYLIGFKNKGEKDITLKYSETSFRYPLDFSYHLQNFTHGTYNRRVSPKQEVTVDYAFMAHESLAGRPLGLVVNLHYEDNDGKFFITNVFNETMTIVEDESGFNTETGFMFLIFGGIFIGLLVVGQHFLTKLSRKTGIQKKRAPVDSSASSSSEVDYEWIPRNLLNKSPKTPGSPRQRKAKKAE